MAPIYEDNSLAIGNTPLVKLNSVTKNCKATVLAKIEGRNPAYSVKCRIGANMIWDAEKKGLLTKEKTIIEHPVETDKQKSVFKLGTNSIWFKWQLF